MEENRREFLEKLCNLYTVFLLAALPLYTGGTYWRLGDTKYLLFRNISLLCLGLWLGAETIFRGSGLIRKLSQDRKIPEGRRFPAAFGKGFRAGEIWKGLSTVDLSVLAYAAASVLSFVFSPYRQTAWGGYRDWYMGALSQLLFAGIYFFVSRNYRGGAWTIYPAEAALLAVTAIGILNRLGIDPLGLLSDFSLGDWEYTHMLSTMGNINWLCGYYSVALGIAVTGFLYSSRGWKTAALYAVSVLSLLLLCIQGSMSGTVIAAACIGVCFLAGLRKTVFFEKGMLLLGGLLLLLPAMAWLMRLAKSTDTLPGEGNVYTIISRSGWWLCGLALTVFSFVLKKMKKNRKECFVRVFVGAMGAAAFGAAAVILGGMKWDDSWGTGRGVLWRLSLEGFCSLDILHRLVGVGPDCFAEYIYSVFPAEQMIVQSGHWQEAVFANAHNEWLNTLVNMGILGAAAYLGIFLSGLKRYRGMLLGSFTILLYGVNSLVSFQQTVSTPLLFLILGMCESRVRRQALPK